MGIKIILSQVSLSKFFLQVDWINELEVSTSQKKNSLRIYLCNTIFIVDFLLPFTRNEEKKGKVECAGMSTCQSFNSSIEFDWMEIFSFN